MGYKHAFSVELRIGELANIPSVSRGDSIVLGQSHQDELSMQPWPLAKAMSMGVVHVASPNESPQKTPRTCTLCCLLHLSFVEFVRGLLLPLGRQIPRVFCRVSVPARHTCTRITSTVTITSTIQSQSQAQVHRVQRGCRSHQLQPNKVGRAAVRLKDESTRDAEPVIHHESSDAVRCSVHTIYYVPFVPAINFVPFTR